MYEFESEFIIKNNECNFRFYFNNNIVIFDYFIFNKTTGARLLLHKLDLAEEYYNKIDIDKFNLFMNKFKLDSIKKIRFTLKYLQIFSIILEIFDMEEYNNFIPEFKNLNFEFSIYYELNTKKILIRHSQVIDTSFQIVIQDNIQIDVLRFIKKEEKDKLIQYIITKQKKWKKVKELIEKEILKN